MLLKETLFVRLLSLRIPSLLFLGPRVMELDEKTDMLYVTEPAGSPRPGRLN